MEVIQFASSPGPSHRSRRANETAQEHCDLSVVGARQSKTPWLYHSKRQEVVGRPAARNGLLDLTRRRDQS